MRIAKFFVENAADVRGVTLIRTPVEKLTLIPASSDLSKLESNATILYTSDTHNAQSVKGLCYIPIESLEALLFGITAYEVAMRQKTSTDRGIPFDMVSIEFRLQDFTDPHSSAAIRRGMALPLDKIIHPVSSTV